MMQHDPVSYPRHYISNGLEVIDVIEDWDLGFHLGNAIKYICRAGKKGSAIEDLEKAQWYIARAAVYGFQEHKGTIGPDTIGHCFDMSPARRQAIAAIFAAVSSGHLPALRLADRRLQFEIERLNHEGVRCV